MFTQKQPKFDFLNEILLNTFSNGVVTILLYEILLTTFSDGVITKSIR